MLDNSVTRTSYLYPRSTPFPAAVFNACTSQHRNERSVLVDSHFYCFSIGICTFSPSLEWYQLLRAKLLDSLGTTLIKIDIKIGPKTIPPFLPLDLHLCGHVWRHFVKGSVLLRVNQVASCVCLCPQNYAGNWRIKPTNTLVQTYVEHQAQSQGNKVCK